MNFETSRTWANLMSAFAGESQARTRYEAYAQKAAEQGQEHALSKSFMLLLLGKFFISLINL